MFEYAIIVVRSTITDEAGAILNYSQVDDTHIARDLDAGP